MVFGWGKKKQEETSVEEVPKDREISLSDVPSIVTDLNELRTSQTVSEIKNLRNNTEPLINDLIKIGNVLDNDNLNIDDIDKHLAIIVVRGKKQVIDVIKKGVTHLPEVSSINDAQKLHSSLNLILKKVGDVLGRQTRVIHIFAKKYANQLKENLEVMNRNHSEISRILKNFESTKSSVTEISNTLQQIKVLQTSQIEKIQKISDYSDESKKLQEKIISLSKSVEEIKSSDEYKKYLDLKIKLDLFISQKTKIKNEISIQFTKISRPLGRYEYASSLDKEQKNILTKLVNEPFDVLVPENKDSIIIILENVRKAISSGSISVKDVEKTLSHITETEEKLDELIKQVSEYFKKYQFIQNDMNSFKSDNLHSLENELNKNNSFRDDSESKIKTFQMEIHETDLKIPQLISEIEVQLRGFSNTRYTILPS
jgi:methyl-accepting chemotaxis protein